MNTPEIAFGRFVTGLLLGCGLGIYYGFLRPLRRKQNFFPDLLFVLGAGWVYLYYGFAVCRSDLRMGYTIAPILGAIVWDAGPGRWLRPVFGGFWHFCARMTWPFHNFLKKISHFLKFPLATGKK